MRPEIKIRLIDGIARVLSWCVLWAMAVGIFKLYKFLAGAFLMIEDKISITPGILAAFRSYHVRHGAWGVFHVLLSDMNLKIVPKDPDTIARFTDEERYLLELLQRMSPTQRGRIAKEC